MCGGHTRLTWPRALSTMLKLALFSLLIPFGLGLFAWSGVAWSAESEDSDSDDDEAESSSPTQDPSVEATIRIEGRRGPLSAEAWVHQSAASVASFDLSERDNPTEELSDLLEEVAGLHVRRFGGPADSAWITIRGSSARQVEVYIDGVPLNAGGSSAVDLSELSLEGFERVEVFRGFAPDELGSTAMGGVVHLTSQPGQQVPPSATLSGGSWRYRKGTWRAGESWDLPSGHQAGLRAHLSFSGSEGNFRYLDNKQTPTNLRDDRMPERANNASNQLDASLSGRLSKGAAQVSLSTFLLWSNREEPGTAQHRAEQANLTTLRSLAVLRSSLVLHERLTIRGEAGLRLRREILEDPLNEIGLSRPDSKENFSDLQLAGHIDWTPSNWLRLRPTVRFGLDSYERRSSVAAAQTGVRQRASFFLGFGAALTPWEGRLAVEPSIGIQLADYEDLGSDVVSGLAVGGGADSEVVAPVPRIAIAGRPADWITVRAAAQLGTRPPGFLELFGDRGGVKGNPHLRPESSRSVDAGIRLRGGLAGRLDGAFEFGGFHVLSEDKIVFMANSQRTVVPSNFGSARVSGIEAAGRLSLFKRVTLTASATWSDSEITSGLEGHVGNRVPHVPALDFDLGAVLKLGPWLRLRYGFRYTEGSFESPTNIFLSPPRQSHSLSARLSPAPDLPWISLEVTNLTDEQLYVRHRDPANPQPGDLVVIFAEDFRGNPLPGRAFYVSLGWSPPLPSRPVKSLSVGEDSTLE